MTTDKYFCNTLEANIKERGAMTTLMWDNAKAQIDHKTKDGCPMYKVKHDTSEPSAIAKLRSEPHWYSQDMTNTVMDRTGCPASLWLLCLLYCCAVLNSVAHEKPHWHTPLEALNLIFRLCSSSRSGSLSTSLKIPSFLLILLN
eukprot:CAMPEP_0168776970 /NCGR_PEP_ID=MMETSP0725-20121227/6313_1 /TAXON_ID=265536 /ORGANISM="Amphiprora sp., Strain CCMP467" /LENGTH=143 /DNA_ID=CAMNT_0008826669 /DNA_START=648 /DNA_END=1076 /DNA_ORIENTATION=+